MSDVRKLPWWAVLTVVLTVSMFNGCGGAGAPSDDSGADSAEPAELSEEEAATEEELNP